MFSLSIVELHVKLNAEYAPVLLVHLLVFTVNSNVMWETCYVMESS